MITLRTIQRQIRWQTLLCGFLIAAVSAYSGCSSSSPDNNVGGTDGEKTDGAASVPETAEGILERMVETYQAAKSYQDKAKVRLELDGAQGTQKQEYLAGVAFARPNRVRITRDGVVVVSDGERIYGKPEGWREQVVVVEAPKKISVPAFYNIEPLLPLLSPGYEGHSTQLDLLTADQPLRDLRENGVAPILLEPESIRGRECHGLEFATDAGKLVLWVDKENWLLHRVQYPTDEFVEEFKDRGVQSVSMIADFEEASLGETITDAVFAWEKSDNETLVRYLVSPPNQQLAPHPLLGQPATAFTMKTDEGKDQSADDLKGKVTVIDVWATWCEYCIRAMPKFGKAYKEFADNEDVRFLALSVDDMSISDEAIAASLKQTGVEAPWARATGENAFAKLREGFQMPGIPAYVILDKENRVQFHHVGGDLDSAKVMPDRIQRILAGEDLAASQQKEWEAVQQRYRQNIQLARLDAAEDLIEITRAETAERKDPDTFKISQRWTNTDVKSPGNILVVESEDAEPKIFVVSEFQSVTELNAAGESVGQHAEELRKKSTVTYLRTAVDGDAARIFVAGSVGDSRFFVFDEKWNMKLRYPEEDTASVYDVLPADLDGDGHLELCVGYYGDAGVHAVKLDGKRIWRNRSVTNVVDLAVTDPDEEGHRQLLCAHSFGTLLILDKDGQPQPPIEIANRAITHILVANLDDEGPAEMAAISIDLSGRRSLIGLSKETGILWQHLLPPGEHEGPIETLTAGRLRPDRPGQWMVATADGAVHFVSADGKDYDKFSTGQKLTGLASMQIDGQGVLLISSADGVTALTVEEL